MVKYIKKERICKIKSCKRQARIKGFCERHYNAQRSRKHRDSVKQINKDNSQEKIAIYFIQAGRRAVKMGITDNIEKRLSAIQTAHYEELKIIHLFKGGLATERRLHFVARKYHIRGEWFEIEVLEDKKIIEIINNREKIEISPEATIDRTSLKNLQTFRKMNGLMGMKEIATKIGVSARTIYRWESGKTMPQQHLKKKLISILNGLK